MRAYNLGTGRGYSVKEVLEAITAETGQALRAPMGLRREGDPAELIADASLGRSELGWNPQLSDLQTIVQHGVGVASPRPPHAKPRSALAAGAFCRRETDIVSPS